MLKEHLSRTVQSSRLAMNVGNRGITYLACGLMDDGLVCEDYRRVFGLHVYAHIVAGSPRSLVNSWKLMSVNDKRQRELSRLTINKC